VAVFVVAPRADVAGLETVGKLSVSGGAEKEEGGPAGARGTIEGVGVFALNRSFGIQGIGHMVFGRQARYGLSAGPLFSWDRGKAGLFVNYQYRDLRANNFVWVRPAIAFYFDQVNLDLWYSHPVSSPQKTDTRIDYGINQLQAAINWFPPVELNPWMRKDNFELTVGLQANTFGGVGHTKLEGAGVGPVFGFAFLPIRNLVVNLFRVTGDSRDRYRFDMGLQYFFSRGDSTLKELRRKTLEPNRDAPGAVGTVRRGIPREPPPPPTSNDILEPPG
jgi:hypothetical protein